MRKKKETQSFDFSLVGEEPQLIIERKEEKIDKKVTDESLLKEEKRKCCEKTEETKAKNDKTDSSLFFLNHRHKENNSRIVEFSSNEKKPEILEDKIEYSSISELQETFNKEVNGRFKKEKYWSAEGYLNMAYECTFQIQSLDEKLLRKNLSSDQKEETLKTECLCLDSMCRYVQMVIDIEKHRKSDFIDLNRLYSECRRFFSQRQSRHLNFKSKLKKSDIY